MERVEEFEIDRDRRRLPARQAAIEAMEEKHLALAGSLAFAALSRARGLQREDGNPDVEALDPAQLADWSELARASESAVRIERLTRGVPTDLTRSLSHVPAETAHALSSNSSRVRSVDPCGAARQLDRRADQLCRSIEALATPRLGHISGEPWLGAATFRLWEQEAGGSNPPVPIGKALERGVSRGGGSDGVAAGIVLPVPR